MQECLSVDAWLGPSMKSLKWHRSSTLHFAVVVSVGLVFWTVEHFHQTLQTGFDLIAFQRQRQVSFYVGASEVIRLWHVSDCVTFSGTNMGATCMSGSNMSETSMNWHHRIFWFATDFTFGPCCFGRETYAVPRRKNSRTIPAAWDSVISVSAFLSLQLHLQVATKCLNRTSFGWGTLRGSFAFILADFSDWGMWERPEILWPSRNLGSVNILSMGCLNSTVMTWIMAWTFFKSILSFNFQISSCWHTALNWCFSR